MALGQVLSHLRMLHDYFKIAPLNTNIKPLLEGDPNQDLINSGLSSVETENVFSCLMQEEHPHQQTYKLNP